MSHNPFSGAMPLNYQKNSEKAAEKATSYIPGETNPMSYRTPQANKETDTRNLGCTTLRRYPNGQLDYKYVAHQVIDIIHKVKDGGFITEMEKAVLSLILPQEFKSLIDSKIAQTMTKLSIDERMMVAAIISGHLKEELNYNSGKGGGSVEGRSSTRS
jgi:hypothetical protein